MERIINIITDCCERLKPVLVIVLTWIATVFMPIKESLYILSLVSVINFFLGLGASIHVDKAQFSLKKAFDALAQLVVFGALAFLINSTFTSFEDADIAEEGVKWLTYIVVYFYGTNIFRNASLMWPNVKAFKFMYDILTTKIFDRLKEMVGFTKKD